VEEVQAAGAPFADEVTSGDFTSGDILRPMLAFSVPTLMSNILQTLNGTINAIWVGQLVGERGLAATANANIVMFLLFSVVFGFGMATTIRVGHAFGARQIDAARRAFGSGLGFCVIVATGAGVLGWLLAAPLLAVLSTPAQIMDLAYSYLRIIFLTMPLGAISLMAAQGLRGVGNSKLPFQCMVLTVAIDAVLNPLLIRGLGPVPGLGIAGSALATAFANASGAAVMIVAIYRQDIALRLKGAELRYLLPQRGEMGYVLAKGVPMGAQMLLVSFAGVIMVGLVNREGLDAAAAYGASLQLWNYLQMPAFALSSAVSAMVAQNVGAGHHARVGQITRIGLVANSAMTLGLAALIVLLSQPLLVLFLGAHSGAVPVARHIQAVCTWSFVISGAMMVMIGTMRAYGAVLVPLMIMFVSMYPVRIGFYFAMYRTMGADALWWSYPAGSVVALLMTVAAYRRHRLRHG
jgi:putative MATE family efflux protein